MKRILLFLFALSTVSTFKAQSLLSLSPNTGDAGGVYTISVVGSATSWTFATPTVNLVYGPGDTIFSTNVISIADDTVTADFTIPCSATVGTYNLYTNDAISGNLFLNSSYTLNGMTGAPVTITDVSCVGSCDGNISVNSVTGGVAPYVYDWYSDAGLTTNIGSGTSITGLCAGTYYLQVTDNNGCSFSEAHTISSPSPIVLTSSGVDILCNGNCDGQATTSATGGSGNYTYAWSPVGSTQTITGLCAGTYTVTVTDDFGCTSVDNVVVTEPSSISSSATQTNLTCSGSNDGTIVFTASGGTPSYEYSIDGGITYFTSGTFTGLAAGSYDTWTRDANACSFNLTVTITEPAQITFASNFTDVSCFGSNDGTIDFTGVTGGTGAYDYSIDAGATFQAGSSFSGLASGTYDLIVQDQNGCQATSTLSISEPPLLTVTGSSTDASCFGVCDGQATASPTGGTGNYYYSWTVGGSTQTVTGLCTGTHTVTVTDDLGCLATANVTINEPMELTISTSIVNPYCNGDNTGSIDIIASGGTGSYQYSIDAGSSFFGTSTFTSLAAGTYDIMVVDDNGCTVSSTETLTQPDPLVISPVYYGLSCFGSNDGSIDLSVITGGTLSYNFSVDAGATFQASSSFNSLAAGSYNILIEDANGCQVSDFVTLTEPTALALTTSIINSNCGLADGQVSVDNVTGGTPGYVYSWDDPGSSTTAAVSNLLAGVYTVTVSDANGCVTNEAVTVNDNGGPTIDVINGTDATCFGLADGSADMTVSGGTTPFAYEWYDFGSILIATTQTVTGLVAGDYTGQVTDANGCTAASLITISEPLDISLVANSNDASCSSACDGDVSANATGGTGAFTYDWAGLGTAASITSVCAGTYTITVTDANGCVSANTVTVNEPALINISSTPTDASCNGCSDGAIDITVVGGVPSYNYSIDGGTNYQASNSFTGLFAGTYNLQVLDANGCTNLGTAVVGEPAISTITASLSVSSPTCNPGCDGQSTATPTSGTAPYTYLWSNGETTQTAIGLCAGSVSLTITDNVGATFDTTFVLLDPSNGLAVNTSGVAVVDALCSSSNGSITGITVSGGTVPYSYAYNNVASGTVDLGSAAPGTYIFTVTDVNGCSASSNGIGVNATNSILTNSFTISDVSCAGNCDGSISVSTLGGTAPYSFSWSNGNSGSTINGVCSGLKTLTVTDVNGCEKVETVSVNEPAPLQTTVNSIVPTCGTNNGELTVNNTSGGTAPYTYQWSNGEFGTTASNLNAGIYSLTTTDANGCVNSQIVSLTSASAPAVSVNAISPLCSGGANGSIDLTITGGTAPITFDWSTGHSTEDLSGLAAGVYDVTISDASGCEIVEIITLVDAAPIDLSSFTSSNASCSANDGALAVSVTGGAGGYNYLWSNGGSSSINTGLAAGSYTLSVSDANSCLAMKTYTVSNNGGPEISVDQVIQPTCQGGTGEIHVSVSGGTAPYNYQWNNGEITSSLFNAEVGEYELIVTDATGCQGVNYAELLGINLNAAEICLVSVDTATGGNVVVWNKEYNLGISEYEVFKETSVMNYFQLIGVVPFDSLTQFVDTTANSGVHSYKYKLRTVDSCGNASEFLAVHKTIHLASNIGLGGVVNLAWDDYIGFTYTTFYINRYHPTTGWELIDSVAANVHSYTDANHPGLVDLQYGIEVRPSMPCLAEKAIDHNSTRSNKVTIATGPTDAGISGQNQSFTVYPNPGSDAVNINTSFIGNFNVMIIDMQGRVVYAGGANSNATVNTENLEDGVYFIKILDTQNVIGVTRWVKE